MINSLTQIILCIICLSMLSYTWYIHYIVKDGLGRKMLLWGCGLLFSFIFFRMIIYFLSYLGIIDIMTQKLLSQYNFFHIYVIVIAQFILINKR